MVRRPDAVRIVTRSAAGAHLNADAGIASDWKFENFATLPARLFNTPCTRSAIGRTNPSGSFAFSTSSFTISRSGWPSNTLRWRPDARAALLARLTRSRAVPNGLCWSGSGGRLVSSTLIAGSMVPTDRRRSGSCFPPATTQTSCRHTRRMMLQHGVFTLRSMITTLRVRIRDRERQKFFGAYLGAKMIGVTIVVLGMAAILWYFSGKAGALSGQDTPALKADDVVNPLNT